MKNSNKKKIQLPVVQNGMNVVVVRNKERRMNWVLPEYIYSIFIYRYTDAFFSLLTNIQRNTGTREKAQRTRGWCIISLKIWKLLQNTVLVIIDRQNVFPSEILTFFFCVHTCKFNSLLHSTVVQYD